MTLLYLILYRAYRLISWVRHAVRRRFTPAGLCVAGGLLAVGSVGVDVENTVSYQTFALLLAFLIFAVACSFFPPDKFSATRWLPRLGTVGQPLTYDVRVKNLTSRPQAGLTLLEDLADPRPSFEAWLRFTRTEKKRLRHFHVSRPRPADPFHLATLKAAEVPVMPPNGEAVVALELVPLRRGLLRFTGVTVARPDPLGLFRAFRKVRVPQAILILPKRYPVAPIALPGALKYQQGGVALAANVGCSEEFVALRDYRHGDPLRHIHWRSWAKTGKPIVKEFEDEFFVRHALVLDTFTNESDSEILEAAVSVAASFACTVLTQESLLDLLFVGHQSYCFTAGRGLGQADQMLEILASVRNCADKPFAVLEHLVLNHLSVVSGCIIVLQRWDGERKQFIEKLKLLGVPVMVLLVTGPGDGISGAGGDWLDAPGSFHVLETGKLEEGLRKL